MTNQEGMTPEQKRDLHRMRREQLEREGGIGHPRPKSQQHGDYAYPESAIERRRRWRREHKMWHDIVEEQERLKREHESE